MAWVTPRDWTTGELVTASYMNEQIRDNMRLSLGYLATTAGDTLYATAANTTARLGIGAANTVMTSTGSAPQWVTSLTLAASLSVGTTLGVTGLATLTGGFTSPAASSITAGAFTLGANGATDAVQLILNGTSGTNRAISFRQAGVEKLALSAASDGNSYFDYQGTLTLRDSSAYTTRLTLGSTGVMTHFNTIVAVAATTALSSIRIPAGTAPSSPTSGDLWYDGTNLKFRDGSTTRTVTWT